jgi:TetR/AcrR family transcriptional repressor of nem operon
MGRPPSFERADAIRSAAGSFLRTGYEGTSIDDLVRSTGVHRGSLYQAFGSKRGLFLASLRQVLIDGSGTAEALDLLLVATLELAPRDTEVRAIVTEVLRSFPDPARVLGDRLLQRAGIENGDHR